MKAKRFLAILPLALSLLAAPIAFAQSPNQESTPAELVHALIRRGLLVILGCLGEHE
jgi:hypothetical protein